MFHLHARVHFNEVEALVLVEELEGAGAAVVDLLAGVHAAFRHFVFQVQRNVGGRRLFHHFLVATLQGAVPVAEMDGVAGAVGQHLDFHMAGVLQKLFHVDGGVAEGVLGFRAGQGDGVEQLVAAFHHAHAAPAAAGGRFDDHRVADFLGHHQRRVGVVAH